MSQVAHFDDDAMIGSAMIVLATVYTGRNAFIAAVTFIFLFHQFTNTVSYEWCRCSDVNPELLLYYSEMARKTDVANEILSSISCRGSHRCTAGEFSMSPLLLRSSVCPCRLGLWTERVEVILHTEEPLNIMCGGTRHHRPFWILENLWQVISMPT